MHHPFPYAPSLADGRLAAVVDPSGIECPADMPLSIRNAIYSRNCERLAHCDLVRFEVRVLTLHPTARVYTDRFGAVALDMAAPDFHRVGTLTYSSRSASIGYPDHLCI